MIFTKYAPFFGVFAVLLAISCDSQDSQQGDQLFAEGKYEEAVSEYTQYIEYNPSDVKSIYNRGRAYEELGEYDKSLADYEAALEIDPQNMNALMSIGKFHFRNENYGDAAFYFDKAIKVKGNSANAHFLNARANHKLGETAKALESYNQTIGLNPNHGEAYLYRGALKIFMKKKQGGCSDLKKARALETPEAEEAIEKYCS